ncbi:FG-GAP-like repeat-containing protein, partial [Bacteroidia bacterium]|nr:FG-GAP-like repeat-containing protein [Bacteroidia bacterium]
MKKKLTLSIFVLLSICSSAQLFQISFDPVFKDANGDILKLALAGGVNQPQFSNMDFNKDGKLDLLVFDRSGNKVLTFISESVGGSTAYKYDPSYEEFFPKALEFMTMKDYNDDGKPDLWFYDGDSVNLMQNQSVTNPDFKFIDKLFALDKVNYVPFNPYKKLAQINGSLPAIVDIDGDKDIDYISSLNLNGSDMIFNCNKSSEENVPLEEIGYTIVDKCFGGISEYNGELTVNSLCFFREAYKLKKKHSATKTILFLDGDNDGDLDLFYGSSERLTNPIYYFENGKADLAFYKDTFIRIDTAYFDQFVENQIPVAPGMAYVDVNQDGELDLVLSTNDVDKSSYPIREKNNVLLFTNEGETDDPDFTFTKNDFLVGDMIDEGSHTAPSFADLDGDGDFDLILATSGDYYYTSDTSDYLLYYTNIGSSTNPEFKLTDEDFLNLKGLSYRSIKPAFADLDGDGDLDLYLGKGDGTITEFLNTGSKTSPIFVSQTDTYGGISTVSHAAPTFYDIDKDGLYDLLLGSYTGNIAYYKNTGSTNAAAFTLQSDTFGGVRVNELITQQILGPGGFKDTLVHLYYGFSTPQVVQWPNGAVCLAVGGNEGEVRVFDISSDLTADFEEAEDYMVKDYVQSSYTKDWGARVAPASADLNGDGVSDLMIGTSRGGLHYLQGLNNPKNTGLSSSQILKPFRIAPNPASHSIIIYANSIKSLEYNITDISGKVVTQGSTYTG